jgi:hypothetical protein
MPRSSLDSRLSKLKTFAVVLTKNSEDDVWKHFEDNHQKYEDYYTSTRRMLGDTLDKVQATNPYISKDNWRRTLAGNRVSRRYDSPLWYCMDDSDDPNSKSSQNFWFKFFQRDMELAGSVFNWNETKPEFSSLYYDAVWMRDAIQRLENEIVETDRAMYEEAKRDWEQDDADWIKNEKQKRDHNSYHKPRSYYEKQCRFDPDAKEWYNRRGGFPSHLAECSICLALPEFQLSLDEKETFERQREEQEEKDRMDKLRAEEEFFKAEQQKRREIENEESRNRWSAKDYYHCEICEYKSKDDRLFALHEESKEHKAKQRQMDLFCPTCSHQSISTPHHNAHMLSNKHKNAVEKLPTLLYHCETCDYTANLKHHYQQHCLGKKHQQKVAKKITEGTQEA